MRDFSEIEKKIIDRLIELDENLSLNVLGNLLSNTFAKFGEYYIKIESPTKCNIEIEEGYSKQIENSGDSIRIIKEILEGTSRDIFVVVKLLAYLENNDLIFTSGDENVTSIGPTIVNAKYISSRCFDKEVCDLLYKYSRKKFYSTETLRRFQKNSYLDDEEIRNRELSQQYRKTIKYSAIAICVSLLGVIVSAFVPVSTNTHLDNPPESISVKIDPTPLSNIDNTLKKIDQSIKEKKIHDLVPIESNLKEIQFSFLELSNEIKAIRGILSKINDGITQQRGEPDCENVGGAGAKK